ncbi:MAG: tetratricopeptide repeat protein [Armatimonas sp.]
MSVPETATCALGITLFGPIQVLIEGQPLPPLRSRKALWLLALLTLRHNRLVERDWLAGTLWPDVNQTRAFSNLRPIVSELRQALGSQAHRLESPSRHTLRLDLTNALVDVRAFDATIGSPNLSERERAVALYTGPLLESCSEEWVFQEREKREQECLQALQALGDSALEAGNYEAAVGHYRHAVGLDPWREAARRGLMEALTRSGDRNAALQVYRKYTEQLRELPQMSPDEETRALYNRLRSEVAPQGGTRAVVAPVAPAPSVTGYVPHALTELIGREDERLEVADCLRRSRLVTLTGVGGIGKTRLALAIARDVAREYPDGVWLISLDSLSDEQQVSVQLASVLGVKEEPGKHLLESITEHLRSKQLLLVLDNCEHLLTACAKIAERLLSESAGVRLLATSREALGITGEKVWSVPALPAPDPAHLPERRATLLRVLMEYDSLQLFVERAEAVQKTFSLTGTNAQSVAQICYYLEGIPLAIELAAAQVRVMTVEQIAARLDSSLGLLTSKSHTGQARQQTLRAALDWSYALLTESERLLLQRLSVFAGGWTLEAAEGICSDSSLPDTLPHLTALVDKSLITLADGRFRMLEMVRQFASERLTASGETPSFLTQHQEWFVALAEEADPHLSGPQQAEWLRRLATEYDNLCVTLVRSQQGLCSGESALRLACALRLYWYIHGDFSAGRMYLTQALEHAEAQARTTIRAKALNALGALARRQSDHVAAQALFEESLSIRRELGESKGIAEAAGNLGIIQHDLGNYTAAQVLYEESLNMRRQLGDKPGIALGLANLGATALNLGDFREAKSLLAESLPIYRELGDRAKMAWVLNTLGSVTATLGNLTEAQAMHEESLSHLNDLKDRNGIAWSYNYQGKIAFRQGDYLRAQELFQESLGIFQDLGEKSGMATSLQYLGEAAFAQGELIAAHTLLQESLTLFQEGRLKRGIAWTLSMLGSLAYAQGDEATGQALFQECLPLHKELKEKMGVAATLHALATAVREGDPRSAVSLWSAAQALRESIGEVMPRKEGEVYARQLSEARSALGEDTFSTAWNAGHTLTWEQAAEYALDTLGR